MNVDTELWLSVCNEHEKKSMAFEKNRPSFSVQIIHHQTIE